MNQPFDPTKPVQTRAGKAAKILATDINRDQPIAARVTSPFGSAECVLAYDADGSYAHGHPGDPLDLVNIPEETIVTRYVAVVRIDTTAIAPAMTDFSNFTARLQLDFVFVDGKFSDIRVKSL